MSLSAYEIPNLRFSGIAGDVIERRRFVTLNADGEVVHANATSSVIGVSSIPNNKDEVAEIYDGIVIVEAGGAVGAGDYVKSDADGKAVTDAAGKFVAITSASVAGELMSVKVY